MRDRSIVTDGAGCAGPSSLSQNGGAGSEQSTKLQGVGSGSPSCLSSDPALLRLLSPFDRQIAEFDDAAVKALRGSETDWRSFIGQALGSLRRLRDEHERDLSRVRRLCDAWPRVWVLLAFATGLYVGVIFAALFKGGAL